MLPTLANPPTMFPTSSPFRSSGLCLGLGQLTVWVTPDGWHGKHERAEAWTKVYEGQHEPSFADVVKLPFPSPLLVRRGTAVGLYVHSNLEGDEGIVYDNQRGDASHEDGFIKVPVDHYRGHCRVPSS